MCIIACGEGKNEFMGIIERTANHYREPKPMNAGFWIKDGVMVWKKKPGEARIPEQMKGEIFNLLWREPQDYDVQVYVDRSRLYNRSKDIVEVKFSGEGGKSDDIRILRKEVCRRSNGFNGEVEEGWAKITKKQITDLIAEKGEHPKEIYWERRLIAGDGDKITKKEYIEITFPFNEIEKSFKPIIKSVKPAKNEVK